MKAVLLTGAGGIDKLELTEVPDPILDDPELILIRLHAAGINPVDYKLRRVGGFYPDRLPLILGCDGAGVVEAVGDAVTRFKVGDEVYFMNGGMGGDDQGNYAELTTIHQDYAALKPKSLSMVEAATVPLVWLTAWEANVDVGNHRRFAVNICSVGRYRRIAGTIISVFIRCGDDLAVAYLQYSILI